MRIVCLIATFFILSPSFGQTFYLFIGTYTETGSKGIYVYKFNSNTGKATWVSNTDSSVNPSFLTISADHKNLYAVNETGRNIPGRVSAYSFDRKLGKLTFLNSQLSGGDDPCHILVTRNKKWAVVSNYSGGSVAVLPIAANGKLERYVQLIQDSGTSINKDRQEMAHVHEAVLTRDEKYLFTPDLGTDKLMEYHFTNNKKYPLEPAKPKYVALSPGSGPRHITFTPDERFAYVIQELSGVVTAFKYSSGKLKFIQTVATHPGNYKGVPGSAEIMISPDSKYLYASNRGEENTITTFTVNPTGQLTNMDIIPSGGIAPRNFIIDPSGKFILVANQNSDNIVIFKRNAATGKLTVTGEQIKIPKPVCLQMIKAE